MRTLCPIAAALACIATGCGDRSTLDAMGGTGGSVGSESGAPPQLVVSDDASLVGDASTSGGSETGAPPLGQDSGDVALGSAITDATSDVLSDAPPPLPCLARPAVDCSCSSCQTQGYATNRAIHNEATANCFLSCLQNYFTFDADGCLVSYKPTPGFKSDDACILEEFGKVRVPCAAGLSQPISVYESCTVPM